MVFVVRALARRLGSDVHVERVRYRLRGWNSPRLDPVRDAQVALAKARERFDPAQIVLVGHSMGGRVAAHVSQSDVGAIVALAPWWPHNDGDLIGAGCRLLVVHGTADRWTDPRSSREQTQRAQQRGVDAQWVGIDGVGHHMVRRWRRWHRLTADFVSTQLPSAPRTS